MKRQLALIAVGLGVAMAGFVLSDWRVTSIGVVVCTAGICAVLVPYAKG